MSLRFPSNRRKSPKAMGLRQMLPVQTKRTYFTMMRDAAGDSLRQGKIKRPQVNESARHLLLK